MIHAAFPLTLLEAKVTLYPADADGAPRLYSPIWCGIAAESLQVRERWVKAETRPTGARAPRRRALVPQYEISIARAWTLELPNVDGGCEFGPGPHVLDVFWEDEDSGDWHRETFYGVTISERSRSSRSVDEGFTDDQTFEAEYVVAAGGPASQPPPPLTDELPYLVRWVGATGAFDLYRHDPVTGSFTEVSPDISNGRVTVGYVPDQAGVFQVKFAGDLNPALEVGADGVVNADEVREFSTAILLGARSEVPRVDFYYGLTRVAAVVKYEGTTGVLLAHEFYSGSVTAGKGKFSIYAGGQIRMTLGGTGVTANEFDTL